APAPLLAVGFLELPLAAEVAELRVAGADRNLRIALQYRAGRSHQLDEREHRASHHRLGPARTLRLLQDQLRDDTRHWREVEPSADAAALLNHNLPLVRLLQARSRLFRSAVTDAPVARTDPLPAVRVRALEDSARRHEARGEWFEALDDWMSIARGGRGADRHRALLAVPQVLNHLGEAFLAEQFWRGLVVYGDDPALRRDATEALAGFYADQDDRDGLFNLLSAVAIENPEPQRLARLVPLLLDGPGPTPALNLGLMLPPGQRPLPELLQASYRRQWWISFEALLDALPEPEAALWRGYRAQYQGDYAAARNHWEQAGQSGTQAIAALDQGLLIARRLATTDTDARLRAIADWERWYAAQPGAREWRDAETLVTDHAGAVTLYATDLDLHGRAFRARPDRPVELRIQGPVRLRVKARLLHADEPERPVDDWLLVRDGSAVHRTPILPDRPAQGLSIAGEPQLKPGRLTTLDHMLGPGLHTVTVSSPERALLVEAEIERPALALAVLPEPTPVTVLAASLAPGQEEPPAGPGTSTGLLTVAGCGLREQPVPVRSSAPALIMPAPATLQRLDAKLSAHRDDLRPPSPDPQTQRRERLIELLWQVEQQPQRRLALLPQAERLYQDHHDRPALQPLMARIRRHTQWQRIESVELSAGLRLVETAAWQPESRLLRVRQALLPPLADDALILSGSRELGLSLFNAEPLELTLELSLLELPFMPSQPLTVAYQLDEGPSRRITL
ncbi:MAG: hypothetical protein R3202_12605, partial [Candidatus Competibacterales bacterium]|nr:hypothetical protein [Candidatus Competibacterales bacterium]